MNILAKYEYLIILNDLTSRVFFLVLMYLDQKKIIYVSEQESSIFLLHFYRIGKSIFNLNCIYQLLVDNLKADKHELEWLLHEKPKNI